MGLGSLLRVLLGCLLTQNQSTSHEAEIRLSKSGFVAWHGVHLQDGFLLGKRIPEGSGEVSTRQLGQRGGGGPVTVSSLGGEPRLPVAAQTRC